MIAVMLVAGVGSFVDWKKEVQFVKSRAKSEEKNVVSITKSSYFKATITSVMERSNG